MGMPISALSVRSASHHTASCSASSVTTTKLLLMDHNHLLNNGFTLDKIQTAITTPARSEGEGTTVYAHDAVESTKERGTVYVARGGSIPAPDLLPIPPNPLAAACHRGGRGFVALSGCGRGRGAPAQNGSQPFPKHTGSRATDGSSAGNGFVEVRGVVAVLSVICGFETRLPGKVLDVFVQPTDWTGDEDQRPIMKLAVTLDHELNGTVVRASTALKSTNEEWKINYQIYRVKLSEDKIRSDYKMFLQHKKRTLVLPSDIPLEKAEEFWASLNFGNLFC